MSWMHGGKLERLAIFCHFTVAFRERFPTQRGPFVRGTKPCSLCPAPFWRQSRWVIAALWQADKPCQGVHKSAVIISSGLVPLKLRYTACRPEPFTTSAVFASAVKTLPQAPVSAWTFSFSRHSGQWCYPGLCSFVGGLLHAIQARIRSCCL